MTQTSLSVQSAYRHSYPQWPYVYPLFPNTMCPMNLPNLPSDNNRSQPHLRSLCLVFAIRFTPTMQEFFK